MLLVAIRVDASEVVGAGHLMRCMTLAGHLKRLGHNILFVCRNTAVGTIKLIHDRGFEILVDTDELSPDLNSFSHQQIDEKGWKADADAFVRLIRPRGPADWVIVDHYGLDARWERAIRIVARKVMVIDDLANRLHACDLILDQTYGATQEKYSELVSPVCCCLLGSSFAILNPEFALSRTQESRASTNTTPSTVHVFFGSMDRYANTLRFTDLLLRHFSRLAVKVAVGAESALVSGLARLTVEFGARMSWASGIPNMAEHMTGCDVAIGAPGMATWERACLGIPAAYIAVSDNQVPILKKLDSLGFCKYIGAARELTDCQFLRAVGYFLGNVSDLLAMREMGMQAIDGRGAERVVSTMLSMNSP